RDADGIVGRVSDCFSLADFPCDPIDRFIGMIFGKGTAPPLEKSDQGGAQLQIFLSGDLAVIVKSDQQPVKGLLGQRPLATGSDSAKPHRAAFDIRIVAYFHPEISPANYFHSP